MSIFQPGQRPEQNNLTELSSLFTPGERPEQSGGFSETMSLVDLLSYPGLVTHLLNSNTFFYGKVGFYRPILHKILEVAKLPLDQFKYVHTVNNFPKNSKTKKLPVPGLILLPIVESQTALNKLLVDAFNKSSTIWLIAQPSLIQKHLLVTFHNFFVASSTEAELASLRDVLRLPDEIFDVLTDRTQSNVLFVTDFEPGVQELNSFPTFIIRLKDILAN